MNFEAVVFPGQGAQKNGMGQDFYESFEESQRIFDEANANLSFDVKEMCFTDDERLHQTAFTQPAIVTTEIAMFLALKAQHGLNPQWFAGHSLGEYAALCAAGVIPLSVTLALVEKRGQLMQHTNVDGAMSAVILGSLPLNAIETICEPHSIDIANDNSVTQVVLSGDTAGMETVSQTLAAEYPDMRIIPLNVSAPFHSRHMQAIEAEFKAFLHTHQSDFVEEALPKVQSNFLGRFYTASSDELIDSLASQLSGRVKWRDNMASLLEKTTHIIEVGPARPLKGFFKTLGTDIAAVVNCKQVNRAFS